MTESMGPRYVFHGGCYDCTQQCNHGVEFCMGCQYFDADWSLPDLSNRRLSEAEEVRKFLKLVHGKR